MNTSLSHQRRIPLWAMHSLMMLAAILVSSSFTVGKAITQSLDPSVLLLLRYVMATTILGAMIVGRQDFSLPPLRAIAGYAAISASTVSFFWCMFEALRFTSAINTSIIFTLVPGISAVYSAIFLGERLGRNRLLALFLGMLGALWVIFHGDINRLLALEINYGDLLFLVGCFLMAAYTPLVKKFHRGESMMVMTFWVLATGTAWLLIPSSLQMESVNWRGIGFLVWAGIVYLALFSTVVTFYLTHLATPYLGPTRVMAYSYCYPAFVITINWCLGNGLPPVKTLPGVLVVSMAIIVVQRGAMDNHRLVSSAET